MTPLKTTAWEAKVVARAFFWAYCITGLDWTGLDWTSKTPTCKTWTSKTRTCKTRTCKTRTCKTRTCKRPKNVSFINTITCYLKNLTFERRGIKTPNINIYNTNNLYHVILLSDSCI